MTHHAGIFKAIVPPPTAKSRALTDALCHDHDALAVVAHVRAATRIVHVATMPKALAQVLGVRS